MTKGQRAQVVELLRCAADSRRGGGILGVHRADWRLRPSRAVKAVAWPAVKAAKRGMRLFGAMWCGPGEASERYRAALLEAAQRIEEGRWP